MGPSLFPNHSLSQMGVEAGLDLERTTVSSIPNFSATGAYPEPNVIYSHPWLVSSPGVIIVCLFKFPCVTLIECLNFICALVSIT